MKTAYLTTKLDLPDESTAAVAFTGGCVHGESKAWTGPLPPPFELLGIRAPTSREIRITEDTADRRQALLEIYDRPGWGVDVYRLHGIMPGPLHHAPDVVPTALYTFDRLWSP